MLNYCAPDSWYDDDRYDDSEIKCDGCDDKQIIIDNAKNYLQLIIDVLYGEEKIDKAQLDDMIGDLCHELEMEMPIHLPKVQRGDLLSHWVKFNNQHLKQLA